MKKIIMTAAVYVLIFASLGTTSNAWAVGKPLQKLTNDVPVTPTKDCITDAQEDGTFFRLAADFFGMFR